MVKKEEMKTYSLEEMKDKYIAKRGTTDRDAYENELLMHKQERLKQTDLTQKGTTATKPSDFAGTLSEAGYQALNKHTQQARNEWDSNTN